MNATEYALDLQTIALVALQLTGPPVTLESFTKALPEAHRLLEAAKNFMKEKDREREAENRAYWQSPEGIARRKQTQKRLAKFKK